MSTKYWLITYQKWSGTHNDNFEAIAKQANTVVDINPLSWLLKEQEADPSTVLLFAIEISSFQFKRALSALQT